MAALHGRKLCLDVEHANFADYVKPADLRQDRFVPGPRVPLERATTTFDGFVRTAGRGAGTRNYLVLLPLSSRLNAFARALEQALRARPDGAAAPGGGLDGVVALPHTEDGLRAGNHHHHHSASTSTNNSATATAANHAHLLRTLVGLLVHPNVGAAIVLEAADDAERSSSEPSSSSSSGPVCFSTIQNAANELGHGERLSATPYKVISLKLHEFGAELQQAAETAASLLRPLREAKRQPCAASALVVAQQCGGSDAFSGTAANPLLAEASRMLVEAGGTALLAETDELIGAEQYVLQSVADFATAERFTKLVARFHHYAADHHTSAEGNPSGGNMLRGLYNIALKSLGAAMKRHPKVRLERVVEYGERLPPPRGDEEAERVWEAAAARAATEASAAPLPAFRGCIGPGYCFMDSPGNDLESIAGQVASGCNLIYFSTGNGSITNFPFVPTIKIISTTRRYQLMKQDMDIDAGDQSKTPEERAEHLFEVTLKVASGMRTRGEAAGHYQLQIWRNWIEGEVTPEPPPSPFPPPSKPASVTVSTTSSPPSTLYVPPQHDPPSRCSSRL